MDSTIQKMIEAARKVLNNAYSPYSSFKVACAIIAENGNIYSGVNVENASYGLTACAETSAIAQMITQGAKSIQAVVLMNGEGTLCPPCGGCRQRIIEFCDPSTHIYLCDHRSLLEYRLKFCAPGSMDFSLKPRNIDLGYKARSRPLFLNQFL